jgi:probable phosphoglycerate mutase
MKHLKEGESGVASLWRITRVSLASSWRFQQWKLELRRQREQLMEETPKSTKRTLLFIRHGQTTWNIEHLLSGQLSGVALTETGREQAARLAEALKILPITAVISSPLERARDTAGYLAASCELTVQVDDDLMDTNVGSWSGQKIEELSKADPAWKAFVHDPTSAPEGVETFPQVQKRAVEAVERWLKLEEIGDYLAFVAHADVVKLLLAHYMELDVKRAGWLSIDNASVSMVELEDEQRPRIVAIGWNPQPGWLKPPAPPASVLEKGSNNV